MHKYAKRNPRNQFPNVWHYSYHDGDLCLSVIDVIEPSPAHNVFHCGESSRRRGSVESGRVTNGPLIMMYSSPADHQHPRGAP